MEKKYIILDMGKVIVEPSTKHWTITPTVVKCIDDKDFDFMNLAKAMKGNGYILDKKCTTLDEEYPIMHEYYEKSFKDINYPISEEKLKIIVDDFVYNINDNKYQLYDDVKEQLDRLSKKYTVLMLSDNWPCAYEYLDKHDIRKYFTHVYISSVYGEKKEDGTFFDYPIEDFNIKPGEALFVDDKESLLDIAKSKGLDVNLMDRDGTVTDSKYKIIHSLVDID